MSGSDVLVTGSIEGTDTVSDTVENFQFADVLLTYAELTTELAALGPTGGSVNALGGDDLISYTGGYATIDGGSGTDTVDFCGLGSAVWVNLTYAGSEAWTRDTTHVDGGIWREIADLANVENITGTAFSDRLYGDAVANVFHYTGGFDLMDGKAGSDTADFSLFGAAVWVNLAYAGVEAWTRDGIDVDGGVWRTIADLANIENITGTAFADRLTGDAQANRISGGAGDDVLTGNGGDDLFVFSNAGGSKAITDFRAGAGTDDVIDLRAFGFTSLADVLDVADNSADLTLQLDADDQLTLLGVHSAELSAQDFIFA
jgi:Ca2+-binding RTX toxin-like protein